MLLFGEVVGSAGREPWTLRVCSLALFPGSSFAGVLRHCHQPASRSGSLLLCRPHCYGLLWSCSQVNFLPYVAFDHGVSLPFSQVTNAETGTRESRLLIFEGVCKT